jgi:octaprenyl-diphosphate synthase
MDQSLRGIKSFLKKDIALYEKRLKDILISHVGIIDQIVKYIIRFKGKNLRPLLVLMSARLVGTPLNNTYTIASVIELLHTATLIHDDVIDNSDVRRSFPSINAVWKNKISVLIGDYFLSKSLIGASQTGNLKVIEIMAETAKRMSRGELFQIEKSRKLNISQQEYFDLIADKTAALFAASCQLGAISVNATQTESVLLKEFGENLGIAFQIKDDLLDYQASQIKIGKPAGSDLKHKNITLPLLLSFDKSTQKEKKQIIGLIKKGVDKNDIKTVVQYCKNNGGFESAQIQVLKYAQQAKVCIEHLPNNRYKDIALRLVDYIVNRKK